jgi:hypothetical protein
MVDRRMVRQRRAPLANPSLSRVVRPMSLDCQRHPSYVNGVSPGAEGRGKEAIQVLQLRHRNGNWWDNNYGMSSDI